MHGDWVAATATVFAAIVGIVGGYFLARYQRERRVIRFGILDTEDLAAALRSHGDFEIKFQHFTTSELVLSNIAVSNLGNCALRDIQFTLKISGYHPFALISCTSQNRALAEQVIIGAPTNDDTDPEFPVSLGFLNSGESFRLGVLYSGKQAECQIVCRLPDTNVEVYTMSELYEVYDRRNRWKTILTVLSASAVAVAVAVAVAGTFGIELVRKFFG